MRVYNLQIFNNIESLGCILPSRQKRYHVSKTSSNYFEEVFCFIKVFSTHAIPCFMGIRSLFGYRLKLFMILRVMVSARLSVRSCPMLSNHRLFAPGITWAHFRPCCIGIKGSCLPWMISVGIFSRLSPAYREPDVSTAYCCC